MQKITQILISNVHFTNAMGFLDRLKSEKLDARKWHFVNKQKTYKQIDKTVSYEFLF